MGNLRNFGKKRVAIETLDLSANRSAPLGGNEVGAVEEDDVGASEPDERFAEKAGRENASAAERVKRVEENDVEVAGDSPMLKRVVEEQNVDVGTRFDESGGDFGASRAEKMRRRREAEGEFARFVVKMLKLGELGKKRARRLGGV